MMVASTPCAISLFCAASRTRSISLVGIPAYGDADIAKMDNHVLAVLETGGHCGDDPTSKSKAVYILRG